MIIDNKIKNLANLILAIFITVTPLIVVVCNVIGINAQIHKLYQIFGVIYLIYLPFPIVLMFKQKGAWQRILEKLKSLPVILAVALYTLMFLNCIITNSVNIFLFYFIVYICIFICLFTIDKKYDNLIINTLIITMSICCFLGFLDPGNKFIPGFDIGLAPLTLMFYNPNYAGYAIALLAILNIWIMCTTDNNKQRIVSIVGYIFFNVYLFMNGSFAPITGFIFTTILMIIYAWIKQKKCPTKLLISFLSIIPFIFITDAIPDINKYRTCDYNYFIECIAVFDNIFGTKLLRMFGISQVAGSDGWGRSELQAAALAEILSDIKIFLFGKGAGGNFYFIPHNTILCLWLNFGIVPTLLYYAINIYLIVRFFKLKNNYNLIGYIASNIGYLIMMMTGDLIEYSFCYHMIVFAITFRKIEQAHALQKKNEQEEHILKYVEEQKKLNQKEEQLNTKKRKTTSSNSKKNTNQF